VSSVNCGHRCCAIRDNPYHRHADPPSGCERCAALGDPVVADEHVDLAELVAEVLAHVVPQIPGLPSGIELAERVCAETRAVHAAAAGDPLLAGLNLEEQRTVLAGRVALALAFGPATPPEAPVNSMASVGWASSAWRSGRWMVPR
jgi:hypothetical protein